MTTATRRIISTPVEEVAGFYIEAMLEYRPKQANVLGILRVWRKRGYFGTADEIVRQCPAPRCKGLMLDVFTLTQPERDLLEYEDGSLPSFDVWPPAAQSRYLNWWKLPTTCSKCAGAFRRNTFVDSYGINQTRDKIAEAIEGFAQVLEYDVDLTMVIQRNADEMRKLNRVLTEKGNGAYQEQFQKQRSREEVFYARKSIMQDIAAGGSLRSRALALLKA